MSKIIAHLVPLDGKEVGTNPIVQLSNGKLSWTNRITFYPNDAKDVQLVITDESDITGCLLYDKDKQYIHMKNDNCYIADCKKIIAAYPLIDNIPLPTDEFIAEWVKCQGKCEVEVEMESYSYEDYEENDVRYELRHKFTDGKLCIKCIPERGVKANGSKSMSEQLKEHLENTPKEQLQKEWKEIEDMGFEGPTVDEFLSQYKQQPPSEEKDVEEAAVALPYPDPKTYRVYDEHMRALHKQIDKERRLWIQGAQWQKQRSEKDVADFQKKIKDANGEFDNFINWLDEQERYKNVYIEYLNVNGNQ